MQRSSVRAAVFLASSLAASACGEGVRTSPLSPTDDAVASSSTAEMKMDPPVAVFPVGGEVVDDDDPELTIENARTWYVDTPPLSYVFEVYDEDGPLVYRSSPVPAGANGQTVHEVGEVLRFDEGFSWRAWPVLQGEVGPGSVAATFRTFNRFGPSCAHLGSELAIVECRRAQYGFMEVDQRIEFLQRIAYDLNRAPAEHAPYGLLIKDTGHNCNGYSCDIICSDSGLHRQWDVLLDEDSGQLPVWNRLGEISVRPCEIVAP